MKAESCDPNLFLDGASLAAFLEEEMGKRRKVGAKSQLLALPTLSTPEEEEDDFGFGGGGGFFPGQGATSSTMQHIDFSSPVYNASAMLTSPTPTSSAPMQLPEFTPTSEACSFNHQAPPQEQYPAHLFNIALQNIKFEVKERVKTFASWTATCGGKRGLSRAGFTYPGLNDETVCFFANCSFDKWLTTDCPWVVHGRGKPNCPFVQMAAPANVQMMIQDVCEEVPNWNDPSYFQVRMKSLAVFDNIMTHEVKSNLAAAGFMGKDRKIVCFACNQMYIGDLEKTVRCPLSVHIELNKNCNFLKMIYL